MIIIDYDCSCVIRYNIDMFRLTLHSKQHLNHQDFLYNVTFISVFSSINCPIILDKIMLSVLFLEPTTNESSLLKIQPVSDNDKYDCQ